MKFLTPIHEPIMGSMSPNEKAGKKFINFCESYISFGRRCYVIQSKNNDVLELKRSKVTTIAERVLHIALSILVVPLIVCTIIKGIHRGVALNGVTEMKLPLPPQTVHAEFGPNAFVELQESEFPKIKTISMDAFDDILDFYPEHFRGYHSLNTHKSIRDLLWEAYSYGSLYAAANPQFSDQAEYIKNVMHVVVDALDTKGKEPSTKQIIYATRLDAAYRACQAVQYRTIQEIMSEILNKGDLADSVRVWWQEYKMNKLDEFILEKHPHCNDNHTEQNKQFPHIKNAYIEALGDEFGLTGLVAASRDIHRPKNLSFHSGLRAEFRGMLDLQEFARLIALDINNSDKESSRLEKNLIFDWYNAGNSDDDFALYSEDKNYDDLPAPTEQQKDFMNGIPFMSTNEAMVLLQHELVGIAQA
jgi:hypothetical protein